MTRALRLHVHGYKILHYVKLLPAMGKKVTRDQGSDNEGHNASTLQEYYVIIWV